MFRVTHLVIGVIGLAFSTLSYAGKSPVKVSFVLNGTVFDIPKSLVNQDGLPQLRLNVDFSVRLPKKNISIKFSDHLDSVGVRPSKVSSNMVVGAFYGKVDSFYELSDADTIGVEDIVYMKVEQGQPVFSLRTKIDDSKQFRSLYSYLWGEGTEDRESKSDIEKESSEEPYTLIWTNKGERKGFNDLIVLEAHANFQADYKGNY